MECETIDLGILEYDKAWKLQEEYAAGIVNGSRPPTLLLLEHPNVYTFGRKGHAENLLWSEQKLTERGAAVYWVDRGGDVTYHGPGQLVGYPLIPLGKMNAMQDRAYIQSPETTPSTKIPAADYVGYIRKLEQTLVLTLARLGLAAGQIPGLTGVWIPAEGHARCPRCRPEQRTKPAKIAAIGVKVDSQGISRHGFALNVNPDMTYWDGIIACGLGDYPVVSLADLFPAPPAMQMVKREIVKAFGEVFDYKMKDPVGNMF